jgi:hypothetical protein
MKNYSNANIQQAKVRRYLGIASTVVGVIASAYYIAFDLKPIILIPIFLVFFVGFLELTQGRLKFCVIFALNKNDLSSGKQKKLDTNTAKLHMNYAQMITLWSFAASMLISVFVVLIDVLFDRL